MKQILIAVFLLTGLKTYAGDQLLFKAGKIDSKAQRGQVMRSLQSPNTHYFVIQFKNVIGLAEQSWLRSLKVEVLRYVPDDAYIVRSDAKVIAHSVANDPRVRLAMAYKPELKVNQKALALSVFSQGKSEKLHVRAFKGENSQRVQNAIESIPGAKVLSAEGGAFVVNLPLSRLDDLSGVDGLEWIDLYHEMKIQQLTSDYFRGLAEGAENGEGGGDAGVVPGEAQPEAMTPPAGRIEDLTGYETGTRLMNFGPAWDRGLNGAGQIVGVADTGLDTGDLNTLNPDFENLKKPYIGGIFSSTWGDPDGHGTHVTGSVLGTGSKSNGKIRGGAYGASLVMESMYSSSLGNLTIPPNPIPLFRAAYRDGARIHTNSWGSPDAYGVYDDTARSADEFMWENPDMLILFAAGNEGMDKDHDGRVDAGSVTAPATAKNVLTVGASENKVDVGGLQVELGTVNIEGKGYLWPAEPLASDTLSNNPGGIAAFSSRGPTEDGRLKPDVVAPGSNILSQCSHYTGAGTLWGKYNDDLCYSGGTSMSTPLVAGAAAVVRQSLIGQQDVKDPSAALVKAVLMHTADDLYPGQFGEIGAAAGQELLKPGPNSDQGYGRVDVSKAVAKTLGVVDNVKGIATDEKFTLALPKGVKKVTLVYTDAPGTTAATKALVNDLDLQVKVGKKTIVSASRINNVEQVVIAAPEEGMELVVVGKNVPMGKEGRQPFALVYSN